MAASPLSDALDDPSLELRNRTGETPALLESGVGPASCRSLRARGTGSILQTLCWKGTLDFGRRDVHGEVLRLKSNLIKSWRDES
jgi:hypothetical protein